MRARATGRDGGYHAPTSAQLHAWGLDPAWSRFVHFEGPDRQPRTWHVLDTGPGVNGTIVAVHGNPTWSYLWRELLCDPPVGWRVLAVDQSSMGFSPRGGRVRLDDRIGELVAFCHQEVTGPLVFAAHDWGGPVAVGASGELEVLAMILANTAVAKPPEVRVPPLIALARRATDFVCRRTPLFVAGTALMAERPHRQALLAPYRHASQREGVADFVVDIPVSPADPSWAALEHTAEVLQATSVPLLLVWGGEDPVFHDRFLRDLRQRAPRADVERIEKTGHLVPFDARYRDVVVAWLDQRVSARQPSPASPSVSINELRSPSSSTSPLLRQLDERRDDHSFVYRGPDGVLSWHDLEQRSSIGASSLRHDGVAIGDRISILIPPSVDLLVAAFSVWRAGGVVVLADASAGLARLRRLVRASSPTLVIGTPATLALARSARFAPRARLAGFCSIRGVTDLRRSDPNVPSSSPSNHDEDLAAIVHTSGATGPAKAVRYSHRGLAAQRSALESLWAIDQREAFATSFGPFMLLAPVLGMSCVRPEFNVNRPSELTFDALARAATDGNVSTAWLSPAAARNVIGTAQGRHLPLRLVMLAGAPIPASLVRQVRELTQGEVRTPYGMTECLPVTDGTEPLRVGSLGGGSTGRALPGCAIDIVDPDDVTGPHLGEGRWGEILVSAPWMFEGYDSRWASDAASVIWREGRRYHRTGDVGYLDDDVLFQLGRSIHVLRTQTGNVASLEVEEPITAAIGNDVAAVAVGPPGASVIALVVSHHGALCLATSEVASLVRSSTTHRIAAVLHGELPRDARHQSKVDRTSLARTVNRFLAGR